MGCLFSRPVPYEPQTDVKISRQAQSQSPLPSSQGPPGEQGLGRRVLSFSKEQQQESCNDDIAIDIYMAKEKERQDTVHKLLLLGTGSSGKSTLFKQMKLIYLPDAEAIVLDGSSFLIRNNCVLSIFKLLSRSQFLYELDPQHNADCHIDLDSDTGPVVVRHIQRVIHNKNVEDMSAKRGRLLSESISYLWSLPAVRSTFRKRQGFSFMENMDYFFTKSKIEAIFDVNYEPTLEDALKSRSRTMGSNHADIVIRETTFKVFDAGGQRSERRKWIQMFDGVTVVLFVAALNHYGCVIFEDESKNAMVESLELFDGICNSKWFRMSRMVLFLNKKDMFEQRLREGVSLSVCFGDAWKGPDYVKQEDKKDDDAEFERCAHAAMNFIGDEYRKVSHPLSEVYVHVTTATDQESVKQALLDVQHIVLAHIRQRCGFF